MEYNNIRISFTADEELRNKLKNQADKENRTVSNLVRNIVLKYLEENQSK